MGVNGGFDGILQVIYDKTTGRSRGFGFVTMSSAQEVEAAARQFNGYVSHAIVSIIWLYMCEYVKQIF